MYRKDFKLVNMVRQITLLPTGSTFVPFYLQTLLCLWFNRKVERGEFRHQQQYLQQGFLKKLAEIIYDYSPTNGMGEIFVVSKNHYI
jgi:hypothetical protein